MAPPDRRLWPRPEAACECSWMGWDPQKPIGFGSLSGHQGDHTRSLHLGGTGPCTGRTSYGTPCECPSFIPEPDYDEEP